MLEKLVLHRINCSKKDRARVTFTTNKLNMLDEFVKVNCGMCSESALKYLLTKYQRRRFHSNFFNVLLQKKLGKHVVYSLKENEVKLSKQLLII